MKVACIQMDMAFADPENNFKKAESLVREAAANGADTVVLPETWNVGFYPKDNLKELADKDCAGVRSVFGSLAKELGVNIVAGSVANLRGDDVYNTCLVFNRSGECVAEYDKTHLFSPMGEHNWFTKGDHKCLFTLDGVKCAVLICYDIRFPNFTRAMTVQGVDMLFMVSQWPIARVEHLLALTKARAIENQMFVVCCNSAGTAGDVRYAGASSVNDPWGVTIAKASEMQQEILYADCDLSIVDGIRSSINVFRDRRPELYC